MREDKAQDPTSLDKEEIDISKWNISDAQKVPYMQELFPPPHFKEDISKWNVSDAQKVPYMQELFPPSHFKEDISKWDVSNAQQFPYTFNISSTEKDIEKGNFSNWKESVLKKIASLKIHYLSQDSHQKPTKKIKP